MDKNYNPCEVYCNPNQKCGSTMPCYSHGLVSDIIKGKATWKQHYKYIQKKRK